MAVITPVTMTLFAIFIANVHGDSTCKITPCNCSFSNIEILSKYIDERINATVAAIVAEVTTTLKESIAASVNTMLDVLSVTVDDKIATVITTISVLNATVDDRISAVNTTVSVLNATVDERTSAVSTTVSALNATIDDNKCSQYHCQCSQCYS